LWTTSASPMTRKRTNCGRSVLGWTSCDRIVRLLFPKNNSVDEMMVAYKGRTSSIKQYIRAKPHPWGFKILARTTATGILCDFDVYQKGDGNRSELGQGADVVLQLTNLQFYSLPYQLMNATKFLLTTFLQVCR